MTPRYEGYDVLAHGEGRCPLCRNDVHRVLIETQPRHRIWHIADLARGGYGPHQCPGAPPPPEPTPLRRAA